MFVGFGCHHKKLAEACILADQLFAIGRPTEAIGDTSSEFVADFHGRVIEDVEASRRR